METVLKTGEVEVKVKEGSVAVYIRRETLAKMFLYAQEATGEISGLGEVDMVDSIYYIKDVRIFKQECSGSDTELDNEELSRFFGDLVKQGIDPTKYRLWWHSHASMKTFFSNTDETCAEELLGCFGDYLIAIVVNKEGSVYARMQFKTPLEVTIENIPLCILDPVEEGLAAEIKREVAEKVSVAGAVVHSYGKRLTRTRSIEVGEPGRNGSWDTHNRCHRNIYDKRVWDPTLKKWVKGEKGQETQCELCKQLVGRFSYDAAFDGWLCRSCKKDVGMDDLSGQFNGHRNGQGCI